MQHLQLTRGEKETQTNQKRRAEKAVAAGNNQRNEDHRSSKSQHLVIAAKRDVEHKLSIQQNARRAMKYCGASVGPVCASQSIPCIREGAAAPSSVDSGGVWNRRTCAHHPLISFAHKRVMKGSFIQLKRGV